MDAFSVLISNRPERTGFLVDGRDVAKSPATFDQLFDAVAAVCYRRWGARTTPFLIFENGALSEDDWTELVLADADRIVSFSVLPEALVRDLEWRVCPGEIRVIDHFSTTRKDLDHGMHNHGIEVSPIQTLMKKTGGLVLPAFSIAPECDMASRRFCDLNFGRANAWSLTAFPTGTPYEDSMLQDVQRFDYAVTGPASIAHFVLNLVSGSGGTGRVRIVAECQIGSALDRISVPTSGLDSAYQIIVGDTPDDLLEHWNGVRWKQNWYEPYAHQLWLPAALAQNEDVIRAVAKWARAYLPCGFDKNRTSIELVSRSWSPASLNALAEKFRAVVTGVEVRTATATELSTRRQQFNRTRTSHPYTQLQIDESKMIRLSATQAKNTWHVPQPEIMDLLRTRAGTWAMDVLVEQPPVDRTRAFRTYWWLLPKKTGPRVAQQILGRSARINRFNYLALSFNYGSHCDQRLTLEVHQPDNARLFSHYYWPPHGVSFASAYDVRRAMPGSGLKLRDLRTSDKGGYLRGLIALFGDLDSARGIVGRKYWRAVFEQIANRDPKKDADLEARIRNTITKVLQVPKERAREAEAAAHRVVRVVGSRLEAKPLSASKLTQLYADYVAAAPNRVADDTPPASTIWEHRKRMLLEAEMLHQLSFLVAADIIRLGVEFRCERCGVPAWIDIDEARQHMTCSGCRHEQSLAGQPEWHYSLNSLAFRCVTEHQMQVLQALCHLAWNHETSFAYSPSVDIYLDATPRERWHEIDLICLCDGKLLAAEVKDTEPNKSDLMDLAEIAEALRVDVAYLFFPKGQSPKGFEQSSVAVRQRLARSHIAFELVELEQF